MNAYGYQIIQFVFYKIQIIIKILLLLNVKIYNMPDIVSFKYNEKIGRSLPWLV